MDDERLPAQRLIVAEAGVASLYWTIADAGDFNGDGRADILWGGDAGDLAEWTSTGTGFGGAVLSAAPAYEDWLVG